MAGLFFGSLTDIALMEERCLASRVPANPGLGHISTIPRYLHFIIEVLYCSPVRTSSQRRVIEFIRKQGLARPRELAALGVPRMVLSELTRVGVLRRHGRGLYSVADEDMSEHRSLAEVAKRVPKGVFCLLSALRFHDLTVQNPHEIWIAIEGRAWLPKIDCPPLRVFRFTGKAWSEGVEHSVIDGVEVAVTNVAKTVADCFKFRNKIGLDVALEALHDAWRKRKLNSDELWHYAEVCRVLKVIRPYLETLP